MVALLYGVFPACHLPHTVYGMYVCVCVYCTGGGRKLHMTIKTIRTGELTRCEGYHDNYKERESSPVFTGCLTSERFLICGNKEDAV